MSVQNPHEVSRVLRRVEDRIKAALLAGRMATWEWDPESDEIISSEMMEALYGLAPGQSYASAAQGFSLLHPEDRESHRALVMAAVRGNGSWHDEFRVVRPRDGEVAWLEERAHTVRNARSGRLSLVGVVWDITERKRAEEALRESDARHALLLQLDDLLRPLADPARILQAACEHFVEKGGMAGVEVAVYEGEHNEGTIAASHGRDDVPVAGIGQRFSLDLVHPEYGSTLRRGRDALSPSRLMTPVIRGGKLVATFTRIEASPHAWSAGERRLQRDAADRAWVFVERARAELAVRRSEEKYRALFNAIDEGFCIQQILFDDQERPIDLRYLEVNRAFESITGLRGVVGRTAHELLLDTQASWLRVQADVALTGEPVRFENYVAVWDRWFDIYSVRVGAAAERKVASVFTDITERRRAEARLRGAAEFDAFRVALNDALRPLDRPAEIQQAATRLLGERLGVTRAFYAEVERAPEGEYLNVMSGFRAAGAAPEPERLRLADVGGTLVDELRAGRIIVVSNVEREPRFTRQERATYRARGVHAFVELPLIRDGALVAILSVQQDQRRAWTPEDVARIEETAQRTWAAVDRARGEEALRRAHEELEVRVQARTQELAETNASLREQIAERHRAEEARNELLRQLVNAQESERRRISRELHDELGQLVSALNLKLSMLRRDPAVPPELRGQLESLEKIARKTDNDLDFLVWQLRPTVLDDLGLVSALRDFCDTWSHHFDIPCALHAPAGEEMRLDPEIETVLYRVAQEALNNVAKHARARHVELRLERGASHASLTIVDDGVGFAPYGDAAAGRGLGLIGMRERATFIGGEFSVASNPGAGTRIKVDVPLSTAT